MRLVVGGAYQGKLDYVINNMNVKKESVADCEVCRFEDIFSKDVLNNFHLFIKRGFLNEENAVEFIERLVKENDDVIIIVNEVGSGVIPVTSEERTYRETVGRVTSMIASYSKEVYRVLCGIGVQIKNA